MDLVKSHILKKVITKPNNYENSLLLLHPFKININNHFNYIDWEIAINYYKLNTSTEELYNIIKLNYFSVYFDDDFKFKFLNDIKYKNRIIKIIETLNNTNDSYLPRDEKLNLDLLIKLFQNLNINLFNTTGFFNNYTDKYSLESFCEIYEKEPSWKIESVNKTFYYESYVDDIISLISWNGENNKKIILETFKNLNYYFV